jgi:hypothetical protein
MAANGTYRLLQGQHLLLRGVGLRQAALGKQQRQAASLVGASLSFFVSCCCERWDQTAAAANGAIALTPP